MERKLGEIFTYNGKIYQVVKVIMQLGLVLYFRQLMLTNIIITLKSQDLRLVFVIRVNMEFM